MKFNRLAKLGLVAAFSAIALAACGSKSTSSSMAYLSRFLTGMKQLSCQQWIFQQPPM